MCIRESGRHWICDVCGQQIHRVSDAWVEWLADNNFYAYGFKLVHRKISSPLAGVEKCCSYDRHPNRMDLDLTDFLRFCGIENLVNNGAITGRINAHEEHGLRVREPGELNQFIMKIIIPNR